MCVKSSDIKMFVLIVCLIPLGLSPTAVVSSQKTHDASNGMSTTEGEWYLTRGY